MLLIQKALPLVGLCLLTIGTASPLRSAEDERSRDSELPGAWPDNGDGRDVGARDSAGLRQAAKLAAEMNQHVTAFEGDENADQEDVADGNFGEEEEGDEDLDDLFNENAADPDLGEEEGDFEDEADSVGETEEEEDARPAEHKDADEDRFTSDTVSAIDPEDDIQLEPESDEIQDEREEDTAGFEEENDDDMDMFGNVDDLLGEQDNQEMVDEENQRDRDEMVAQPFSPKVEKR